jgi:cysteine desulfurase
MGTEPRRAINESRRKILMTVLGCNSSNSDSDESSIWFTGCGTESDNLAVQLALQSNTRRGKNKPHIVTSNVEHPAVELYLKYLEEELRIIDVTYVPVDEEGIVSANDVLNAITDETILVTVMLANNESGSLQPIREIATTCRQRGVLIHTDAAQAVGKVSVHLQDLGYPDMISIVGHKIGAPKGIAALYVRPGCLDEEQYGRRLPHNHGIMLIGGGQEFGRRGGTENVPAIVGLGRACELAQQNLQTNMKHMEKMRSRLLQNLQSKLGGDAKLRVNGPSDPSKRLPNTLSIGFDSVHSGKLLASLSQIVAASAGATCHGTGSVSSVLQAMKVPLNYARGTLRLSLGPGTSAGDVDGASEIIANAVKEQWAAAAQ